MFDTFQLFLIKNLCVYVYMHSLLILKLFDYFPIIYFEIYSDIFLCLVHVVNVLLRIAWVIFLNYVYFWWKLYLIPLEMLFCSNVSDDRTPYTVLVCFFYFEAWGICTFSLNIVKRSPVISIFIVFLFQVYS